MYYAFLPFSGLHIELMVFYQYNDFEYQPALQVLSGCH